MIGEIIFTVIAFVLFAYILLLKMIKKNDTTYLIILGIQAIGILINLLKFYFNILDRHVNHSNIIYTLHNSTNSSVFTRSQEHKCFRNNKNNYGTKLFMVWQNKESQKGIN